jgi:uncharacterized protein (TIGR00369 family)
MIDPLKEENIHDIESGFRGLVGFRLVEWRPDFAMLELKIGPQHLNRSKVLHGGVLTTLIDTVCGYAGCYCTVPGNARKAMTLSLTTSFTGQASTGTIRAIGRKRSGGRKIYVATAEVFNGKGELIALGESTQRYRSGSEPLEGSPA